MGVDVEVGAGAHGLEPGGEGLRRGAKVVVGAAGRRRAGDHQGARVAGLHAGPEGLEIFEVLVGREPQVGVGALGIEVRPEVRLVVGLVAQDLAFERRRQVPAKSW